MSGNVETANDGSVHAVVDGDRSDSAAGAFLGLGSSMGDREANLSAALCRLDETEGIRVSAVSPLYESPHVGLRPGDAQRYPPHLNCVAEIETTLSPEKLLAAIEPIEIAGGRVRGERWGPRTIDIDILLFGDARIQTERLTVPHPGLMVRAFVLAPLASMAPALRLPDGRTAVQAAGGPEVRSQPIRQVRADWYGKR